MVGPDFILKIALWLPLDRFVWKARAQGNGGVGTKEGPVRDKWCGGFRRSSRRPRFPVGAKGAEATTCDGW